MKTKERCLQFIENINDTAERLTTITTTGQIRVDVVQSELKNILRFCEYLQDSIEQEN